ncbi:MAG TPA: hypothetical protein VFZ70_08035 [Euzebyales bacterium]
MDTLRAQGRTLIVATLLVALLVPTAALAQDAGTPLSQVPDEYEPALRLVADELGVSYDDLATASAGELQGALCTQLDATSTDELVADTRTALAQVPDSQLQALSDAERARLDENLPGIIARIETEYCAGAGEAPRKVGDVPVPERVDTGGGGTGDDAALPLAFGALFATLFGAVGITLTGRRGRAT